MALLVELEHYLDQFLDRLEFHQPSYETAMVEKVASAVQEALEVMAVQVALVAAVVAPASLVYRP